MAGEEANVISVRDILPWFVGGYVKIRGFTVLP